MKKKLVLPMLILSLALSSAATGCSSSDNSAEATDTQSNLNAVEVEEIQPSVIEKKLTYAGKIEAEKSVGVTPKVSGRVESILVDEGDTVTAGQTLFTIEKRDYQEAVDTLESQLKVSDASVSSAQEGLRQTNEGGQAESARLQLSNAVDNAKKSVDSAKEAVNNAQISVDTAKLSYDDMADKYDDYKKMYDGGVISKSDFDAIELGYTQAQNAYNQAKIGLTTAQNTLEQTQLAYEQAKESLDIYDNKTVSDNAASAQNSVDTAAASRDSVVTSLNQAKQKLADTVVKAPCDGVISAKSIELTNMVSAGSNPMTITDTSTVTVNVNVSETLINKIAVGDEVKVNADTVDEEKTGIIKTITGVTDATGTYPVKIEIENTDNVLKPGMFAAVEFVESKNENAFSVARDTVIENESEQFVYVLDGSDKVKKVVVETGIDNGEYIEITSGVKAGDKVVVSGQDYLSDGQQVNVVSSDKEEK